MSKELNMVEESVKEVLIDLMTERVMSKRVMSVGVQESSMRGRKTSLSTAHGFKPSWVITEKRTKHRDDLENEKLIPTILPDYILPLASTVSFDSVPRDFDDTMVTAYLPKGIHVLRS
jgi:hypothetical protein